MEYILQGAWRSSCEIYAILAMPYHRARQGSFQSKEYPLFVPWQRWASITTGMRDREIARRRRSHGEFRSISWIWSVNKTAVHSFIQCFFRPCHSKRRKFCVHENTSNSTQKKEAYIRVSLLFFPHHRNVSELFYPRPPIYLLISITDSCVIVLPSLYDQISQSFSA